MRRRVFDDDFETAFDLLAELERRAALVMSGYDYGEEDEDCGHVQPWAARQANEIADEILGSSDERRAPIKSSPDADAGEAADGVSEAEAPEVSVSEEAGVPRTTTNAALHARVRGIVAEITKLAQTVASLTQDARKDLGWTIRWRAAIDQAEATTAQLDKLRHTAGAQAVVPMMLGIVDNLVQTLKRDGRAVVEELQAKLTDLRSESER